MDGSPPAECHEKDWRLEATLEVAHVRDTLHAVVRRFRGPSVTKQVEASVPHDIVITHDREHLFAYAADQATLDAARRAIESVFRSDRIKADIRISCWDNRLDDWRQTDPPADEAEAPILEAAERDAESIVKRTLVVSSGKLIRAEFVESMLEWAKTLGVNCETFEHPHLLTTQVGFTVTGPKRKVEEFSEGLKAEERATIRTERAVMLGPL